MKDELIAKGTKTNLMKDFEKEQKKQEKIFSDELENFTYKESKEVPTLSVKTFAVFLKLLKQHSAMSKKELEVLKMFANAFDTLDSMQDASEDVIKSLRDKVAELTASKNTMELLSKTNSEESNKKTIQRDYLKEIFEEKIIKMHESKEESEKAIAWFQEDHLRLRKKLGEE